MSWVATVFAAVLGAAAGGAGMLGIAALCVKWCRITSFEGASGYFVVMMALAGALGGLVISAVASRVAVGMGGEAWIGWGQIAAGLGAVAAGLLVVLTGSYLGGDHERELGGRGLSIAWEVRLPASAADQTPAAWPDERLRLQLVSVSRRRSNGSADAVFDRAAFRLEDGQWVLPARVELFTSRGEFCVNLKVGGIVGGEQAGWEDGFWPRLTAFPNEGQFAWSAWERTNGGRDKGSDRDAVMYRWRFERSGDGG